MAAARPERHLHPGAWWLWALGLATAASQTTNPLLLALVVGVLGAVVQARRIEAPWARGFKAYLLLGLVVIGIRVFFRILLGGGDGDTILFELPEIPLPEAAAGIRLGGPVSAEGMLSALYDGLRLATLLTCIGAVNVLTDPKRLLKAMPAALHEIGVAVTVALSVAPQLVESAQRVRRARLLRAEPGRRRVVREVAIPVLTDALDRSLRLAAAMDVRGYGRRSALGPGARRLTGLLLLTGLVTVCAGLYGVLDAQAPGWLGTPVLLAGTAVSGVGFVRTGRRAVRSRYRPDPWALPEWLVAASGVGAAAVVLLAADADPLLLYPRVSPPTWPDLPLVPAAGILLGVLPAFVAPVPPPEVPATLHDEAVPA